MTSSDLTAALAAAQTFVTAEQARLDHTMIEHQCLRALHNINRKFDQDSSFEAISAALRETLKDNNPKTLHKHLLRQAHILNSTFYWCLNEAATDKWDGGFTKCKNAFTAQKQFRQSLQLLNQLADEKRIKRTNKKAPS